MMTIQIKIFEGKKKSDVEVFEIKDLKVAINRIKSRMSKRRKLYESKH